METGSEITNNDKRKRSFVIANRSSLRVAPDAEHLRLGQVRVVLPVDRALAGHGEAGRRGEAGPALVPEQRWAQARAEHARDDAMLGLDRVEPILLCKNRWNFVKIHRNF